MKKILIPVLSLLIWQSSFAQNIGINSTGANPDNSAMLDIVSTSRGLLMPRVALTASNAAGPIAAPVVSLLVYNTATAGVAPNNVTPGFYYWDGSAWQRFDVGNNTGDWKILGNANTTAGTNFLGTTNGQALDFRTNNTIRFQIANGNQVFAMADGTTALPFYSWNADPNMGIYRAGTDQIGLVTNATERFRIPNANQVHAMADGTTALPFYSWNTDANTGMWSSGADLLNFSTNAIERFELGTTEAVINDVSNDYDFRVESDGDANAFVVNGGTDNVGIGDNGTSEASAKLNVVATNKGILAPRVALTSVTAAGPITAPATGLLVYNTATAGVSPNNVVPGYYYNSNTPGAPIWKRFSTGNGDAWQTLGNAGTVASTNFLGTTDNIGLQFRTNNLQRFEVSTGNATTGGHLRAFNDGTTALPVYSWNSDNNTGMWTSGADLLNFSTNALERLELGTTEAVFNDISANFDLRVESDNNANMFLVDAGVDRVSVGSANTNATDVSAFNVTGMSTFSDDIFLRDGATNIGDYLARIYDSSDDGVMDIYENNTVDIRLHANGNSFYNRNASINRVFSIGAAVPFYPTLDMMEVNSIGGTHYSINGYSAGGGIAVYGENLASGFGVVGQGNGAANWAGYMVGDFNVTGGYFNISDKRLKQNIEPIQEYLPEIMKLKVYSYNYIQGTLGLDSERKRFGFLAQELQEVFPSMVEEKPIVNSKESVAKGGPLSENFLAVSYTELIPITVQAIQEQQNTIESLEKRIQELEKVILEMNK